MFWCNIADVKGQVELWIFSGLLVGNFFFEKFSMMINVMTEMKNTDKTDNTTINQRIG